MQQHVAGYPALSHHALHLFALACAHKVPDRFSTAFETPCNSSYIDHNKLWLDDHRDPALGQFTVYILLFFFFYALQNQDAPLCQEKYAFILQESDITFSVKMSIENMAFHELHLCIVFSVNFWAAKKDFLQKEFAKNERQDWAWQNHNGVERVSGQASF